MSALSALSANRHALSLDKLGARAARTLYKICGNTPRLVVDTARDERLYPLLLELEPFTTMANLFKGDTAQELADASPYLVRLGEPVVDERLTAPFFGDAVWIAIDSPLSDDDLRRHLRKFTMVRSPEDEAVFFRFFDPRVLRLFLPTCSSDQLEALFKGQAAWLCETEGSDALFCFRRVDDDLLSTRLPLNAAPEGQWV